MHMEKNNPGFTYKMLGCELTVTQGLISVTDSTMLASVQCLTGV